MLAAVRFDLSIVFFFNDTATTEIYTLSLHDALPIYYYSASNRWAGVSIYSATGGGLSVCFREVTGEKQRSEEHTSELQSLRHLVCRLLLEKKNNKLHGERAVR